MLRRILRKLGMASRGEEPALPWDLSPPDQAIIRRASPFTMTGVARLAALIQATRHVVKAGVPGSMVECGVWRGGSMMAVALTLLECGDPSRDLWLYDTFAGMPQPGAQDVRFDGVPAARILQATPHGQGAWCGVTLEETRANLATTGYPKDRVRFIEGPIEATLPQSTPDGIALLRLDTDWYASTRFALEMLYPRLHPGGILILDDYGYWRGARLAVDEFLATLPEPLFLHRIDETGRLAVKR